VPARLIAISKAPNPQIQRMLVLARRGSSVIEDSRLYATNPVHETNMVRASMGTNFPEKSERLHPAVTRLRLMQLNRGPLDVAKEFGEGVRS
jgi:hypothetical protein